ITITFTGGGTQSVVNDPALDGAFIQTAAFLAPPPPPPSSGEPPTDLSVANQILVQSMNESVSVTQDLQQIEDTGGGGGTFMPDKEKKKELPLCR
ncbi:MAG TPA: hypothetical protein VNK67_01385, partial [Burkholderiales bacterium]|nr:hypothetical protein [Burkholderiales bacterium]